MYISDTYRQIVPVHNLFSILYIFNLYILFCILHICYKFINMLYIFCISLIFIFVFCMYSFQWSSDILSTKHIFWEIQLMKLIRNTEEYTEGFNCNICMQMIGFECTYKWQFENNSAYHHQPSLVNVKVISRLMKLIKKVTNDIHCSRLHNLAKLDLIYSEINLEKKKILLNSNFIMCS